MDDIANLILSGSVLMIALVMLTFAALVYFNAPSGSAEVIYITEPAQFTANASIGISISMGVYMRTELRISVNGNNTNFSIEIERPGIPYGIPITASNSTGIAPINASIIASNSLNSSNSSASSLPIASYSLGGYYVLVPRLYPNTQYTVTMAGSSSPVCIPGRACPDFIVGIHEQYNIETGSNGSIVNLTATLP